MPATTQPLATDPIKYLKGVHLRSARASYGEMDDPALAELHEQFTAKEAYWTRCLTPGTFARTTEIREAKRSLGYLAVIREELAFRERAGVAKPRVYTAEKETWIRNNIAELRALISEFTTIENEIRAGAERIAALPGYTDYQAQYVGYRADDIRNQRVGAERTLAGYVRDLRDAHLDV